MGGTSDLTRQAATYLACVSFAVTYLLTTLFGSSGLTAAFRGAVVAGIALLVGRCVIGPALASVIDAMARDQAAAEMAKSKEDE